MTVLQLISSAGFFGAENVVVELASSLAASGDSVTIGVFSNRHAGGVSSCELAVQARARGLKTEVFECGGRVDLRTVAAIRRYCRENGVEVIHSHGYKSNIYSYLANRSLKIRIVTTCHNWINTSSKMSLYTRLDKFFLKRFDSVVAVSDAVKNELLTAGIEPRNILVIGNGINLEKFREPYANKEKVRAALGIPPDAFVAGTVGRLSPEKGHNILLQAASEVLSKKENCYFLFVGDGTQKQNLEEQAMQLGISDRVIFTGKRSDIPEVLSAMDVFVLSSLTEGQPMALLEAMAAGVPAVCTSVGDVPKILRRGQAGLIVPPSDSNALAEAILKVLNDPALASGLSASALRTVKEEFSSGRMAAEYRACYKG